jgi:hypothetical protein
LQKNRTILVRFRVLEVAAMSARSQTRNTWLSTSLNRGGSSKVSTAPAAPELPLSPPLPAPAHSYNRLSHYGDGDEVEHEVSVSDSTHTDNTGARLRLGDGIRSDARLAAIVKREDFFLRALIPQKVSFFTFVRAMWSYCTVPRLCFVGSCFLLYFSVAYTCSAHHTLGDDGALDDDEELYDTHRRKRIRMAQSFCNGGPLSSETGVGISFKDYKSTILNSVRAARRDDATRSRCDAAYYAARGHLAECHACHACPRCAA